MQKKLANALRNARVAKRMTLRGVEKLSKGKISNAYISQLEMDYVDFPHPHHLKTLASIYGVSFVGLLILAGYITPKDIAQFKGKRAKR